MNIMINNKINYMTNVNIIKMDENIIIDIYLLK